MNIAMLTLCVALYCASASTSDQSALPTLRSNDPGVQVAGKAKCSSLNKTQCRKRKKCEWRGKANKCLPK